MSLKFFINAEEMANQMKGIKEEIQLALEDAVKQLSAMTHAKVTELAQEKLSGTRKIYMDNLEYKEVVPGLWVVSLDQPAMWIEEGRKSGDMTEDLLRKGAHVSKDGNRYKAIPFDHGKPPSSLSPLANGLVNEIKKQLKARNIPFKKLELDAKGSPRLGKLHTLDLGSRGGQGATMNWLHKAGESHPLQGVSIYQSKTKSGNVRRDIMTFRMVSDKHKGTKWIHPGREAEHFFEKALKWAEEQWETEILPQIMNQFDKGDK